MSGGSTRLAGLRPPSGFRPARRAFLAGLGLSLAAAGLQEVWSQAARVPPKSLLDNETQQAIERGLAYLESRQNENGSFGRGGYAVNVAVVALAGMAFLSRGYLPGRGKYGVAIQRCVEYLLRHTEQSGFINAPAFTGPGPMYGHGFATLFLAEAYGSSNDGRIRDRLSRAVKLIVATQNEEGGWRYFPQRADADLSVTICQVMALRAARNAGLFVPNEVIGRSIEYVKRCQNADGGFMYQATLPGISEYPRSAAGVVALYSAGIYEGEEVEKGLQFLVEAAQPNSVTGNSYFFYGQYYAAQAMYQAGDKHWSAWYPTMRDQLKRAQRPGGEWADPICSEYGTAMACIILQMPNSHLPIFQR